MKLNYRKYGSGDPVFVLHGVFGSSDNWQTLGKQFAEKYTVYLIDLRNHGNSPHSDEMNYKIMAEDLRELMEDEVLRSIHLVGHSMGGKVAMWFATSYPVLVDHLVVVDISPRSYPPHHQAVLEGFHSLNLSSLQSRKEAEDLLAKKIPDFGVRQFILKNLTRNDSGEYLWKINLKAIEANQKQLGEELASDKKFQGETLFIGGSKSDYIQEVDHNKILYHFPQAKIATVPGAGHWVHAEKPAETARLVTDFFSVTSE